MDYLRDIKRALALKGYRKALVRDALLNLFLRKKKPLSASLLLISLKKRKFTANKTTVYRILNLLEKEGVIERVKMQDNQRWYEAVAWGHHHHAVCEKCGQVTDIDIPPKTKRELEKLVLKKKFNSKHHAIEFFGLCAKCR